MIDCRSLEDIPSAKKKPGNPRTFLGSTRRLRRSSTPDTPAPNSLRGILSNTPLDPLAIDIFKTILKVMSMANFILNDRPVDIDIDGSTPLLWVLRDTLKLNGTKFGCGLAQCGACTVHLDGQAIRSCVTPVAAIEGRSIKTIESIGEDKVGSAVQQAWVEHDVPQCGYCQSGQIMSAVGRTYPYRLRDGDPDRRDRPRRGSRSGRAAAYTARRTSKALGDAGSGGREIRLSSRATSTTTSWPGCRICPRSTCISSPPPSPPPGPGSPGCRRRRPPSPMRSSP